MYRDTEIERRSMERGWKKRGRGVWLCSGAGVCLDGAGAVLFSQNRVKTGTFARGPEHEGDGCCCCCSLLSAALAPSAALSLLLLCLCVCVCVFCVCMCVCVFFFCVVVRLLVVV